MTPFLLKLLIFLLLGSFLIPLVSQAITIENPLEYETFDELINALINFIFTLALAVAPIMIIIAGFYFITAAGDPAKVRTARNIILYTVIGLFIVFLAKGIIVLIKEVLRVS